MLFKKLSLFLVIFFLTTKLFAVEKINKNGHELNFFTGNFDFSDDKQSAYLFGFQHQDENLNRETFLGNLSPITGGFVTENSAAYVYTGVEWNVDLGGLKFTPSFAPGYYEQGGGKNMGDVLEFKSEIKIGFDLFENTNIGFSYSHLSNNDMGTVNPGSDNQSLTISRKF